MFEHRGGHPATPDAGEASRLPRDHGSLALSITDALPGFVDYWLNGDRLAVNSAVLAPM
jgi:hypothetical protein